MSAPAEITEFECDLAAAQTAPYWGKLLAAVYAKLGKPRGLAYYLRKGGVPGRTVANRYPIAYAMRKEYWPPPRTAR